jgi:hypothetical protein
MKTSVLTLLLLLLLTGGMADSAVANPSTKDPDAVLQFRPGGFPPGDHVKPDYDAIAARYRKAKTETEAMWQRHEGQKLTVADAKKVAPLVLLHSQLSRDAELLKLRGEASGWDLAIRVADLSRRLEMMVRTMLKLPGLPLAALNQQIERDYQLGLKRVPQIEALIKRGQVCQAEGENYEILDSIRKNAIWFPGNDFTRHIQPFPVPSEAAIQLRRELAGKELRAIVEQFPDFDALRQELTTAAASIGMSGQIAVDGAMVSGPMFLQQWHARWPLVQAASQRALMAQRTLEQLGLPGDQNRSASLQQARADFANALPGLLAAVIQADAQRAPAAEAATRYPEYVAACATICGTGPREAYQAAFEPPLQALAAKGGLEAEIAAYRLATEPLLGWKRLFARTHAQAATAGATPVHDWASKVFTTPYQTHSILPPSNPSIQAAAVNSSVDLVLPAVLPAADVPKLTFTDLVPANASGQRWLARYRGRVFGLTGPPDSNAWKREVAHLEQGLLVNEQAAPPTLAAAISLHTARTGMFESAGGPLSQATVDGLLSRFSVLSDEAAALLPRGVLEDERIADQDPTQALRLRCDLATPRWFQHECFVLVQ